MKAEEFDKKFDDGEEDITGLLDLSKARRPAYEQRRVNVDFPVWMISLLDKEAGRLGVPRQSLIKMIVSSHLEARAASALLSLRFRVERIATDSFSHLI